MHFLYLWKILLPMLAIKTHFGEENNHTELNIQTELNESLSDDHKSGKKRVFNWVLLHFSNGDSDSGYSDYSAKQVQPWGLGKLLLKNNWKILPKLKVLWMQFYAKSNVPRNPFVEKKKKINGKNSFIASHLEKYIFLHTYWKLSSVFSPQSGTEV